MKGWILETRWMSRLLGLVVKKSDIVDNLTSTDTDKPLSAAQGKALNEKKISSYPANTSLAATDILLKETSEEITQKITVGNLLKFGGHIINETQYFTSSTSWAYTGASITIPANSQFYLAATIVFSNALPLGIGISMNIDPSLSYENVANNEYGAGTSYCGYFDHPVTLYFHAKYNAVASNEIRIQGYYITL